MKQKCFFKKRLLYHLKCLKKDKSVKTTTVIVLFWVIEKNQIKI